MTEHPFTAYLLIWHAPDRGYHVYAGITKHPLMPLLGKVDRGTAYQRTALGKWWAEHGEPNQLVPWPCATRDHAVGKARSWLREWSGMATVLNGRWPGGNQPDGASRITQRCQMCGTVKEGTQFPAHNGHKNGLGTRCITCNRAVSRHVTIAKRAGGTTADGYAAAVAAARSNSDGRSDL